MVNTFKNNKVLPKKIVEQYIENGIKIKIEMPEPNEERDKEVIEEVRNIMNNELLMQMNK